MKPTAVKLSTYTAWAAVRAQALGESSCQPGSGLFQRNPPQEATSKLDKKCNAPRPAQTHGIKPVGLSSIASPSWTHHAHVIPTSASKKRPIDAYPTGRWRTDKNATRASASSTPGPSGHRTLNPHPRTCRLSTKYPARRAQVVHPKKSSEELADSGCCGDNRTAVPVFLFNEKQPTVCLTSR